MDPSFSNSNIPILQELTLERERLLKLVSLSIRHKITLVVAPPGYGKTTLAVQFANRTECPAAWHRLEERERDTPTLVEHCLHALATVVSPLKGLQAPKGLAPTELALFVTDHLRSLLKQDVVYILDDVHHLLGSPSAESWLRTLVANLPPLCHLILMGRALPALPLTEMIARREALAIGQEQLRFTFDEVTELVHRSGKQLSAIEIQQLVSRLAGWPAGTILAIQPLPTELEAIVFAGARGPEALFDGLAQILLSSQSSGLQKFLLASSTLSQMSPALCQASLQLDNSVEYLNQAINQNLFISQISGGLVYHGLFREFLQRQLKAHNPDGFTALHVQAANWFERNNRWDEAFEHYITADHKKDAAKIAEQCAQLYWSQGKAETVLHWRTQLGDAAYTAPQLVKTCAIIHFDHYEYDLASAALSEAAKGFQEQKNETGLHQVTLLHANIDNFRGEYQQAIDKAQGFNDESLFPSDIYGFALSTLGTAYLNLGELDKALSHLIKALPHWRAGGDTYALCQLLLTLEVTYLRLGRFEEATDALLEVVSLRRTLGNAAGIVMALNNLGYHYHLMGQYEDARRTMHEGLEVSIRVPEKRAESYLLWSLGDLLRDCGDFIEANTHYHQALQRIGNSEPPLRSGILTSISTLFRWEGRLEEAQTFAEEAIGLAETYQVGIEKLKAQVALWACRAYQQPSEQFVQEIEQLAKALSERQAQARMAQTLGLCAHLALVQSDTAAASQYLKRALKEIDHSANLQPLIAEIFHSPLLKGYVSDHIATFKPVQKGLQALQTAQVQQIQKLGTPIEKSKSNTTLSLRVWALGKERIERDGKLVSSSTWQAATARELFSYLLFQGAATRDQIGLVFWPDSSPEQIRMKFHVTLQRVRRAVGTNVILFEDDLYQLNPDIDLWCDVHEYKSLIQQARIISPYASHAETLWHRAVDLYKSDLLPSIGAEWILSYRETLREEYLEALLALANCGRVRNNFKEAITILKQAIGIDPYREETHRALFLCYAQSGKHNLIKQHLQELSTLFQTELGISPSTETITLVQTLLT